MYYLRLALAEALGEAREERPQVLGGPQLIVIIVITTLVVIVISSNTSKINNNNSNTSNNRGSRKRSAGLRLQADRSDCRGFGNLTVGRSNSQTCWQAPPQSYTPGSRGATRSVRIGGFARDHPRKPAEVDTRGNPVSRGVAGDVRGKQT